MDVVGRVEKHKLNPCPFCGAEARVWEASWTGFPRIGCDNPKCLVRPATPQLDKFLQRTGRKRAVTVGLSIRELVNHWNARTIIEQTKGE